MAYNKNMEVDHLSFGATNHIKAAFFYRVLGAGDFINGLSGNGLSKKYDFQEIKIAKAAL
ncbi:hypothetical protein [Mucilaginibacter sp. SJ]|uniref:hypothetical protein n=1 Tax=Mucilaginibacter sp. SJ TaxID=3029053 RepID=UPI0023AA13F6|nr:hypothetical protein [Mucilaginibacter sp. SJ]WEA01821.1 hypothetical protein MusilaSJ_02645 [Mucilaginibacter sp. SJ]